MKKIYYLELDSEHARSCELEDKIWDWFSMYYWGFYATRKEAHAKMVEAYQEAKAQGWLNRLKDEADEEQVFTIDLWKAIVDDDFDVEEETIWLVDDRQLLECRYLVGRY